MVKKYQDKILQCNIWENYDLTWHQYPDIWNFKDKTQEDQDSADCISIMADISQEELFER